MKIIKITIAIIFLLLIYIISCDDSPTRYNNVPDDSDFPNSIGMLWKYEVYDSLSQTTDTVWFSITDTVTMPSGEFYTEWKSKNLTSFIFEWQYLHLYGDTLEFFDDSVGLSANERIVFPLELGNGWSGPATNDDTSLVTLIGYVGVPAGIFAKGARIDRSWNLDFEEGGNWSQTWVVPDVGIVSRYFLSQFSDGSSITVTKNETWKLIEYDLTTFELQQFPNKVGNQWIYEERDSVYFHHDSIIITYDTVMFTIVGSGNLEAGYPYTLWESTTKYGIDTQFVVTYEERLSFIHDTEYISLMDYYFDFPIAVGRTWGLEYFTISPEVLDKEMVITSVQTFMSSFHTYMSGSMLNDYWTQEDWLVPGVGIVKSRHLQFGFIPSMNRTRTLIDYTLVD